MAEAPVLETLSFSEKRPSSASASSDIMCIFCQEMFSDSDEKKNDILKHMLIEHKFVISDVKLIADFKRYISYWRQKFKDHPITEFCSVINTNTKDEDIGPKEKYHLLCDVLPEDKQLREVLQKEKLVSVLERQQQERLDTSFSRTCLFCKEHFQGNREDHLNHMNTEHNFNVGLPDNLVFVDELLDKLEAKLNSLQCLYCEKTFKDRHTLKEHMRKKQHKRLRGNNHEYDKYYIINYLEFGKSWETIQSEHDEPLESDSEREDADDWSEWQEDAGAKAVCLFCSHTETVMENLMLHMKNTHGFNLHQIKEEQHMNFYQQVKLINYIRRQVYQNCCHFCQEKFSSKESLFDHLTLKDHIPLLPPKSVWDQPQYFFPTYENDSLLCGLEDEDEDGCKSAADADKNVVVAEDLGFTDSILKQTNVLKELQDS